MADLTEVAEDTYRISLMEEDGLITYNQFLIYDNEPVLIHTGFHEMYDEVREAVGRVVDPADLRYVVILHFEADECGAMQPFVSNANDAELVCCELSAEVNINHWDFTGSVRSFRQGETLDTGDHRLRFLETPHVHHWDSMMVYDEYTRSLFSSDLFMQPGDKPPVIRDDCSQEMCFLYRQSGIFGAREPVLDVVDEIESIGPEWIHPMHGGSIPESLIPNFIQALRENDFTYENTLLTREIERGEWIT